MSILEIDGLRKHLVLEGNGLLWCCSCSIQPLDTFRPWKFSILIAWCHHVPSHLGMSFSVILIHINVIHVVINVVTK